MKFFSKIVLITFITTGFSSFSQAQEEEEKAPSNPWTECGIGAMIFPKVPVGAVISNITWDLGTTAVTSAGLSPDSCEGKGYAAAIYISETFANLEEETAIGKGQYLSGLMDAVSCDSTSRDAVVSALRSEYSSVLESNDYSTKTPTKKAEAFYGSLQTAVQKAGNCAVI